MTIRAQLRDWYRDAKDKSGAKRGRTRRSLEVARCFAPLRCWVVAWTAPPCRHLALAMDASTLGQRFTILSISVVVRGCAIPVAWRVVEATRAGAWRPHWEALCGSLQGSVPADGTVLVLADRGLYARWLFPTMPALGWHPFLRINRQGHDRVPASATCRPLTQVVSGVGQRWAGPVIGCATPARQLACTLLARWDAGYRDPWLLLTALPPTAGDVAWYGLRAWIECGFKGQHTRRLAWGTDQDAGARTGRAALARPGGGALLDHQGGLPGRSRAPQAPVDPAPRAAYRPQAGHGATPGARAQLLPAWPAGHPGRALSWSAPAGGVHTPRTVAEQPRDGSRPAPCLSAATQSGIREKPTLERRAGGGGGRCAASSARPRTHGWS